MNNGSEFSQCCRRNIQGRKDAQEKTTGGLCSTECFEWITAERNRDSFGYFEQLFLFFKQGLGAFLTEPAAFDYAVAFTNILLTTSILFGLFYVLCNSLQAMGAATPALIVNLSRQGIIYIPALFILQAWLGVSGLVWAQPVADILSTALVLFHYFRVSRKMIAGHR